MRAFIDKSEEYGSKRKLRLKKKKVFHKKKIIFIYY